MALVTVEYDDGTRAWWTVPDDRVETEVEPVLGEPDGIRA